MNDDVEYPLARIIDFGHAKKFENSSTEDCICHCKKISRGFSAPELLRCEPHSFSADIWSVGATYYYLITGLMCTDSIFLDFNTNFGPSFPSSGKSLIKQMIDPNPSRRPTAEMVVNSDFFKEVISDELFADQKAINTVRHN